MTTKPPDKPVVDVDSTEEKDDEAGDATATTRPSSPGDGDEKAPRLRRRRVKKKTRARPSTSPPPHCGPFHYKYGPECEEIANNLEFFKPMTPMVMTEQAIKARLARHCKKERARRRALPKCIQCTEHVYTKVAWHTQELYLPVSLEAQIGCCTDLNHIRDLAEPRKDLKFVPHGTEEYPMSTWHTEFIEMMGPVKKSALNFQCTEHLTKLAEPKPVAQHFIDVKPIPYFTFSIGRTSMIWNPSKAAKTAEASERTKIIAELEWAPTQWCEPRSCCTKISPFALMATASARTIELAKPRPRAQNQSYYLKCYPICTGRGSLIWRPSVAAMRAEASDRINELCKPKCLSEGFKLQRDPRSFISPAALHYQISYRIEEISKPRIRLPGDD